MGKIPAFLKVVLASLIIMQSRESSSCWSTRLPRGPAAEASPQLGQILHLTRKTTTKTARGPDALRLRS